MEVRDIIWVDAFVDKIWQKHHVKTEEVEEVLESSPKIRFIEQGDVKGENVYAALGQTKGGRYLIVFFILKENKYALIISARDMSGREKKLYEKK
ncbi:MAG: hypothetical protein A2073_01165 [Deltaproteobacteria bacterium GWC2_42_11]|nr:MAG: hypothetical protein A2073_01165 [Deltaproteobacteria bacterium GWC2_42_11]